MKTAPSAVHTAKGAVAVFSLPYHHLAATHGRALGSPWGRAGAKRLRGEPPTRAGEVPPQAAERARTERGVSAAKLREPNKILPTNTHLSSRIVPVILPKNFAEIWSICQFWAGIQLFSCKICQMLYDGCIQLVRRAFLPGAAARQGAVWESRRALRFQMHPMGLRPAQEREGGTP